jgi:hypothetical protein
MAATHALGACAARRVGSSPTRGTKEFINSKRYSMSTIRKIIWDEGMAQETVQWVDEHGNEVKPVDDIQYGEIWDKGMPQESREMKRS